MYSPPRRLRRSKRGLSPLPQGGNLRTLYQLSSTGRNPPLAEPSNTTLPPSLRDYASLLRLSISSNSLCKLRALLASCREEECTTTTSGSDRDVYCGHPSKGYARIDRGGWGECRRGREQHVIQQGHTRWTLACETRSGESRFTWKTEASSLEL